jgi:hypothetical protein
LLGYTLSELAHLQVDLERDAPHADGTDVFFDGEPPAAERERLTASARAGAQFETYVALEPFAPTDYASTKIRDDAAVIGADARAWSVRESDRAAECAVETTESKRRRGLGRQVTAAWATHVLAQGKVPFYSHKTEKEVSRALARSLGLTHVFTVYLA